MRINAVSGKPERVRNADLPGSGIELQIKNCRPGGRDEVPRQPQSETERCPAVPLLIGEHLLQEACGCSYQIENARGLGLPPGERLLCCRIAQQWPLLERGDISAKALHIFCL